MPKIADVFKEENRSFMKTDKATKTRINLNLRKLNFKKTGKPTKIQITVNPLQLFLAKDCANDRRSF